MNHHHPPFVIELLTATGVSATTTCSTLATNRDLRPCDYGAAQYVANRDLWPCVMGLIFVEILFLILLFCGGKQWWGNNFGRVLSVTMTKIPWRLSLARVCTDLCQINSWLNGSCLKFQSHKYTRHRWHIPDGKETICDKKTQNLVPSKSTRTQNLCHAQITPESWL